MEIKLIKIGEIKPRPNNPKKHWVEKISESIREFGYVEPIVLDEGDMIIAGHGRLEALKSQGAEEVEVIVKRGLTEAQKDKYMLLSNKVCEAGGWDKELLEKFDEELLYGAGFSSEDLDEIFEYEAKEDNFNAGEEYGKIIEPKVKLGDLYQLGNHRLLCGDATKREDVEKLAGGGG
jgi:ParB-like chromosome segregation protein Spo0J